MVESSVFPLLAFTVAVLMPLLTFEEAEVGFAIVVDVVGDDGAVAVVLG